MTEENISQEFRLKNLDETINYFLKDLKQNGLISRKHKKICRTLSYIRQFLTSAFTITGCISISSFAFLLSIPIEITSFQ